jgi:uncharacterized metal-binding protein YceD (DUF177 family)
VKNKHKYTIPFTGLSYGQHEFKFTIDKAFFELFEESELHNGLIEIHIDLYKTSEILNLDIDLEGTVNIECDRCLDTFSQPIEFQAKLNIEFGDESSDISDADENIILSRKETDLDLSQHFYDYINLALPIRRIHPKDKNGKSICNKEMIKKLKELTNEEKETETDPRWDTLKNLLN